MSQARSYLNHWFPIAFERDLEVRPLSRVTVFGQGFVVFRDAEGQVACLPDRCPHRNARLSDGQWEDGRVECLYHGWSFRGDGACTHIPQLPEGGQVPAGAHLAPVPLEVIDGLVWIYPGAPSQELPAPPSSIAALAGPDVHCIDFATDLPYSHAALIENVLDFAHIHIAHDGVRGGGHRHHAGPLKFDIEDRGALGFQAEFLSPTNDDEDASRRTSGATVTFDAPTLVHYESTFHDASRISGLALYALPLTENTCRLLYRAYGNLYPSADRERPRWREHLHQMALLEQDMSVVLGQTEEQRSTHAPLRDQWMPIKSSDPLVIRYAQWIDAHAIDSPGAIGWAARADTSTPSGQAVSPSPDRPITDRWSLHTQQCKDCSAALTDHRQRLRRSGLGGGLLLLAAALTPLPWALAPALGAAGCALWARSLWEGIQELTKDVVRPRPRT